MFVFPQGNYSNHITNIEKKYSRETTSHKHTKTLTKKTVVG